MSIKIEIVGDSNEELTTNLIRFAAGFGLVLVNGMAPVASEPVAAEEKKTRGRRKAVAAEVPAVALDLGQDVVVEPAELAKPVAHAELAKPVAPKSLVTKEIMEAELKVLVSKEKGLEKARTILEKHGYKLVRDIKEEHYDAIHGACVAALA